MLGEILEQKSDAEEQDDDADPRQCIAAGEPCPKPVRLRRRRPRRSNACRLPLFHGRGNADVFGRRGGRHARKHRRLRGNRRDRVHRCVASGDAMPFQMRDPPLELFDPQQQRAVGVARSGVHAWHGRHRRGRTAAEVLPAARGGLAHREQPCADEKAGDPAQRGAPVVPEQIAHERADEEPDQCRHRRLPAFVAAFTAGRRARREPSPAARPA